MSDANGFGRDTADLPDEERPVDEPAEPDPEAVADTAEDEVPDEERLAEPDEADPVHDV